MNLSDIVDALVAEIAPFTFAEPVSFVYNPLEYARASFDCYLRQYGQGPRDVILLGMNPGPWGMAQTGIPFGEVTFVRDWLRISAAVGRPKHEHPKRPILGFDCRRSEVSGARLWGWARDTFKTPSRFFRQFFVANYCPLVFMEQSGRNRVPEKLPAVERLPLLQACDNALRRTVEYFGPRFVIGVGKFAEERARNALRGLDVTIGGMLHPSPASPLANRGWPEQATRQLTELGISIR
jgi:single-strand selective monofunctional uracil DNA glycosylase